MFPLSPEDQKKLDGILKNIDLIVCAAMPEHVPDYSVVASGEQGFGLVPHNDMTTQAVQANRDKLHSLYKEAIPIVQKYNLEFQARRTHERYALKSVEIFALNGKDISLTSKMSLDDSKKT